MKLTKRETVLVALLLSLLAGLGAYLLLFKPLRDTLAKRQEQFNTLDVQKSRMENILANPSFDKMFDQQLALAAENYDSFYSVLNSYTIDNIIRTLLDDQQLSITKLKMSPYITVLDAKILEEQPQDKFVEPTSQPETVTENAAQNLLLQCTVELSGGGSFDQVMKFVDAINAKSFCVSVQDMQIQYATPNNQITEEMEFSCTLTIYGIAMPEGITLT